jgi:hypothetical protein
MDSLTVILIAVLILIFIYRYYTVNARCKEVGQELNWNTFWNKPEIYEMVTSPFRGTPSERHLVTNLLLSGFKPTAIYHDLIVESDNGKTAQIDLVVATDVGLIVIEVKDFAGWIFGKGNQDYWTQISRYGRNKNRFYNPFKQNEGHIKALRGLSSQMATLPMYSLVVFTGRCKLKDVTFIPRDCYLAKFYWTIDAVYDIINSHPSVHYTDRWEVANLLKAAVDNGDSIYLQAKHVHNIHDMLGTNRKYE